MTSLKEVMKHILICVVKYHFQGILEIYNKKEVQNTIKHSKINKPLFLNKFMGGCNVQLNPYYNQGKPPCRMHSAFKNIVGVVPERNEHIACVVVDGKKHVFSL